MVKNTNKFYKRFVTGFKVSLKNQSKLFKAKEILVNPKEITKAPEAILDYINAVNADLEETTDNKNI
jgi:hypothetical protein